METVTLNQLAKCLAMLEADTVATHSDYGVCWSEKDTRVFLASIVNHRDRFSQTNRTGYYVASSVFEQLQRLNEDFLDCSVGNIPTEPTEPANSLNLETCGICAKDGHDFETTSAEQVRKEFPIAMVWEGMKLCSLCADLVKRGGKDTILPVETS